jgi:GNAT superfamily N-acetyltransferase
VRVREATREDAELLAEIQRRSSLAALAHIYPPEEHPFPTDAVLERWRTFGGRAWLADELGFVGVTAPWIDGLYVVPEAWGTGVSGELHGVAIEALRNAGVERAQLWVLEHNRRARRFYERRGWLADGSTRVVEYPPHPLDVGYALEIR